MSRSRSRSRDGSTSPVPFTARKSVRGDLIALSNISGRTSPNLPESEPSSAGSTSDGSQNSLLKTPKPTNWLLASFILVLVSVLVTTSSQLSNYAFTDDKMKFNAPFLFLIVKMSFRVLTFPVFLLVSCAARLWQRQTRGPQSEISTSPVTWRVIVNHFCPSVVSMMGLQIGWILGLSHLPASIATAIFCSAVAASYILTCIFMDQQFLLIKSIFVVVAFVGVGLIVYGNTIGTVSNGAILGIVATVIAAVADALHLLAFKKAFPHLDIGQTSFVVSTIFLVTLVILWPLPLVLELIGVESIDLDRMPYSILVTAWLCSALSSLAGGYGLVISNPFFMSIAELLILAGNSGIDVLVRGVRMHPSQIVGTTLIGISFLVLILPDDFVSLPLRALFSFNRFTGVGSSSRQPERDASPAPSVGSPAPGLNVKASPSTDVINVHGLEKIALDN